MSTVNLEYKVAKEDFSKAGEASSAIKKNIKKNLESIQKSYVVLLL